MNRTLLDDLGPSHPRSLPISYHERRRRKSIDFHTTQIPLYKYQPLPSSRSIRLLQLLGFDDTTGSFISVLRTCDVDHSDYAALSYTWGPPSDGWEDLTPPQRFSPRYRLIVIEEAVFNVALLDMVKTPQLVNNYHIPDDKMYSLAIRQNLSDFFKSFSSEETNSRIPTILHLLWIDAICIKSS
jgi:hypothetical protein